MANLFPDLLGVRSVSTLAYLAYLEKIASDPGCAPSDGLPNYAGGFSPAQLFIEPDVEKSVPVPARDDEIRLGRPDAEASDESRSEFVPRRSSETPDSSESQLYGDRRNRAEVLRVALTHELAVMQPGERAVIIGPAGMGKTVACRLSAARQARESHERLKNQAVSADAVTVPILVSMPDLCDFRMTSGESPGETLRRSLTKSIKSLGVETPVDLARKIADCAHEARVWLWLDALDEVADDKEKKLNRILSALESWQCRVVITTRPYGLRKWPLPFPKETLAEYRLAPFLPHQSKAFVDKRFEKNPLKREEMREALRRNHSVRLFAENPFLLTLSCQIIETGAVIHDDMTRGQLFESAIKSMFPSPTRASEWFIMLAELAWTMQAQSPDDPHITDPDLIKALRKRDKEVLCPLMIDAERLSPVRRLANELSKQRILFPSGKKDTLVWAHRSMGEYFAGRHLAEKVIDQTWKTAELKDPVLGKTHPVLHWLDRKAWLESWADTIVFAVGRMVDPSPLLEMLADADRDDDFRHRLALACRCIPEIDDSSAEVNPTVSAKMDAIATDAWSLAWRDGRLLEDISPLWASLGGVMRPSRRINGIPARSVLVDLITDDDIETREAAADAVGRLGPTVAMPEIVSRLFELTSDSNSQIRTSAADAIGRLRPVTATLDGINALLRLLRDDDIQVRFSAGSALGDLGGVETVSATIRSLTLRLAFDQDWRARQSAIFSLIRMDPSAVMPEVISALLVCMRDSISNVRACAASALGRLGPTILTPKVLDGLLSLVLDSDVVVRMSAAGTLGELGPAAAIPEVVRALLRLMRDSDEQVRASAASALGKLGPGAARTDVFNGLIGRAVEGDSIEWTQAMYSIGILAAATGTLGSLESLFKLSHQGNWRHSGVIAFAMVKTGHKAFCSEGVKTLIAFLNSEDAEVRRFATLSLGMLGAAVAMPDVALALLRLLRDDDRRVRYSAIHALGEISVAVTTPEIVASLLGLLFDHDQFIRRRAASSLIKLAPAAVTPEVVKTLLGVRRDDIALSHASAEAIGLILELGYRWRFPTWLRHVNDLGRL